jgi:NAD(P)-dependent dehydrogenase (short-subunit alcohol dehydrogenase family)
MIVISVQARVQDLIEEMGRGRPLDGEVILVTGAGRGIGRESAVVLSRLGAAIVVAELSEAGEETATTIQEAGGSALFVRADVSDETAMERVHDQALARYGHVDVVVNNACVFYARPVLEHSLAEWDRVMAVNLRGAFLAARLHPQRRAVPRPGDRNPGRAVAPGPGRPDSGRRGGGAAGRRWDLADDLGSDPIRGPADRRPAP